MRPCLTTGTHTTTSLALNGKTECMFYSRRQQEIMSRARCRVYTMCAQGAWRASPTAAVAHTAAAETDADVASATKLFDDLAAKKRKQSMEAERLRSGPANHNP